MRHDGPVVDAFTRGQARGCQKTPAAVRRIDKAHSPAGYKLHAPCEVLKVPTVCCEPKFPGAASTARPWHVQLMSPVQRQTSFSPPPMQETCNPGCKRGKGRCADQPPAAPTDNYHWQPGRNRTA
mmetsp:Transcript_72255/g.224128  ORF Transcript_72255/g.224128 Transcript_72255/m.224128 type:complete len:125 (-) Transcript_72255:17-391(-)